MSDAHIVIAPACDGSSGFVAVGPFHSITDAMNWTNGNEGMPRIIISPEDYANTMQQTAIVNAEETAGDA
jgi:hypothetical protein